MVLLLVLVSSVLAPFTLQIIFTASFPPIIMLRLVLHLLGGCWTIASDVHWQFFNFLLGFDWLWLLVLNF